ncbi:SWIM zinc finger family protein [Haloarcula sp. 1CSR25-25]|uniref:SWIM zinc finger family protein n=1 Tax=Haloarcula sp. 1CSR25-25 TaxID=2862545 RepID=UPI0028942889|nr:SWIM zinc finger family protein [Haloarcula sp. 1CSR25-25]MDT3433276.1 SWIM zinc finger family protein [Haloarcula sp. 1CSR25-25]
MHPLEALTFSSRVAKRAQYERFDITPVESGFRVRNESHANPAEHEYLIAMDGSVPSACTCPADERFDSACKHRVAIAIRRPDRDLAQSQSTDTPHIRSDGGPAVDSGTEQAGVAGELHQHTSKDDPDDCEDCLPDVPCWECYRLGRRTFADY